MICSSGWKSFSQENIPWIFRTIYQHFVLTRSLCRCLAPSITFLSLIRDKDFRLHPNERARTGDLGRKLLHDALKLNNVVKTECYPLHLCTFIKDLTCRFSLQMLWIMKFSLAKIFFRSLHCLELSNLLRSSLQSDTEQTFKLVVEKVSRNSSRRWDEMFRTFQSFKKLYKVIEMTRISLMIELSERLQSFLKALKAFWFYQVWFIINDVKALKKLSNESLSENESRQYLTNLEWKKLSNVEYFEN